MLKLTILTFLLLHRISAFNQSSTELITKSVNTSQIDIFENYLKVKDHVWLYGGLIEYRLNVLRATDLLRSLDQGESHVDICSGDFNVSTLSHWEWSTLIEYDKFLFSLYQIPRVSFDMAMFKKAYHHVHKNKEMAVEVQKNVTELSERLECLQRIKAPINETMIEGIMDLYEVYCYGKKYEEDIYGKEEKKKECKCEELKKEEYQITPHKEKQLSCNATIFDCTGISCLIALCFIVLCITICCVACIIFN